MARRPLIVSSSNVRLKAVRRLARRGAPELCLAEGARSVRAAFAAGAAVQELYVAPDLLAGGRDADLLAAADRCGAAVVELGSWPTRAPISSTARRRALAWLREREVRIVATTPAAHEPYWASSYTGAVAVALGSERHGLPPAWLEAAGEHVSVPVHGPVDSLNVVAAAGVVLCEAARSR